MDFYEEASLVMVPSGYKDQKVYSSVPDDGSADLTFSRASNATRVNSEGLVEKVRTNLVTYSEDWTNAAWTKTNATVTANATTNPIDGASTADAIFETITSGQHNFFNGFSATIGNEITISFYAKANGRTKLRMNNGSSGITAAFDLTAVTASMLAGTGTPTITSVGSGWYRCSIRYNAVGSTEYIAMNFRDDLDQDVYAGDITKGMFFFGAQAETGDIATDYIATTSAAVSVGPVSGLPRLDYSGGASCPALKLEPQRTNAITFSENVTSCLTLQVGTTVTANATASPDGYQNADLVAFSTSSYRLRSQTVASATTYTMSLFFKNNTFSGNETVAFNMSDGVIGGLTATIKPALGTATFTGSAGAWTNVSGKVEDYGGGWYRVSATGTSVNGGSGWYEIASSFSKSVYLWGFSLEIGAYATSYIPTLSSAVTRVADVTTKSGISSLIGQSNGTAQMTFVMDSDTSADATTMLGIHAGTSTANRIQLLSRFGVVSLLVVANNSIITNVTLYDAAPNEVVNVAFKYGAAGVTAYVNGTQVYTTASAVVFTETMELFTIGNRSGIDEYGKGNRVSQSLLFTTALSNDDLATLTTL